MKRFMNTMFVFVALFALVFSAFSASPAYAVDDITRPIVATFTVGTSVLDDVAAEFTIRSNDTDAVAYLVTADSEAPHPVYPYTGSWAALTPATDTAGTFSFASTATYPDGTYTLYPWVKDAAGNVSLFYYGEPATVAFATYKVDRTPVATVTWLATDKDYDSNSAVDYTNVATLSYKVQFSEPVYGFALADLSFTGSTAATRTPGNFAGVDGDSLYTFDVVLSGSPITNGTVNVQVSATSVTDAATAGNANLASNIAVVTFDDVKPTVATFTLGAHTGLDVAISAFTGDYGTGVPLCGYKVTSVLKEIPAITPAVPTVADGGWTGVFPPKWTAPAADAEGYTLYPWVIDCAGNISATSGTGVNTGAMVAAADRKSVV